MTDQDCSNHNFQSMYVCLNAALSDKKAVLFILHAAYDFSSLATSAKGKYGIPVQF
jgi:hypothetical protein